MRTVSFLKNIDCRIIAEVGVGEGRTSEGFARHLNGEGELHLFDFEDKVDAVKDKLTALGFTNVLSHPNSRKTYDDYNWSLMKLMRTHSCGVFDYIYLDGAHTWNHDALAFFLIDRLLKIGGFIEFDDYRWTLRRSVTMNPKKRPQTLEEFTDEQIRTRHIGLVVDLLVKPDPRYQMVVENRIFKKAS